MPHSKKKKENLKVSIPKDVHFEITKLILEQTFLDLSHKLMKEYLKNKYYNSGDLIGKQGVEQQYEEILRGVKGVKYLLQRQT